MSPLPKEEREEVSSAQKKGESALNCLPTDIKQHKHDLSLIHGSAGSPRDCLRNAQCPNWSLQLICLSNYKERFLYANTQNV